MYLLYSLGSLEPGGSGATVSTGGLQIKFHSIVFALFEHIAVSKQDPFPKRARALDGSFKCTETCL